MTSTLARHISIIQSPFLMKIVGLDSNSNLVFVVKISAQSKILVQGGLILDCICSVKYGAFSIDARPFLDTRKIFMIFFVLVFFKIKLNNFLVGSFLSGIGLIIEFHLQSAFTKILESF